MATSFLDQVERHSWFRSSLYNEISSSIYIDQSTLVMYDHFEIDAKLGNMIAMY